MLLKLTMMEAECRFLPNEAPERVMLEELRRSKIFIDGTHTLKRVESRLPIHLELVIPPIW